MRAGQNIPAFQKQSKFQPHETYFPSFFQRIKYSKVSSFDGGGEGSAPDSLGPSITADVRWQKKKKKIELGMLVALIL